MASSSVQTEAKVPPRNSRIPPIALHAAGLLSFSAVFAWLPRVGNPLHRGFGGSHQFLTIIGLSLSTATFSLGLLADVFPSRPLLSLLKTQLAVTVTPIEVLISVFYWSLRAVDKRLVVPPGHEVPFLVDVGFHAMPTALLTLDLLFLSPPWTIRPGESLALGAVSTASYFAWLEYCYTRNKWYIYQERTACLATRGLPTNINVLPKRYPYPFLMKLSVSQKLALGAGSALFVSGSTMALKWTHRRILGINDQRRTSKLDKAD